MEEKKKDDIKSIIKQDRDLRPTSKALQDVVEWSKSTLIKQISKSIETKESE